MARLLRWPLATLWLPNSPARRLVAIVGVTKHKQRLINMYYFQCFMSSLHGHATMRVRMAGVTLVETGAWPRCSSLAEAEQMRLVRAIVTCAMLMELYCASGCNGSERGEAGPRLYGHR
jgi:hypothetical protein